MNMDLTEEQKILRQAAEEFLRKECPKDLMRQRRDDSREFDSALWQKMANLGWMGVGIKEEYGGSGGNFSDLAVLIEAMGGVCLPVPFFSTVVISAATLEQSSASDLKTKLLPRITAGELVCSYAVTEPGNTYGLVNIQTKAIPDGDGFSINGSKLFVEYARSADYLLTVVREGKDLLILMVDSSAPGIEIEPYDTLDYADQCEVRFNQVKVPVSSVIARGGEATTLLKNLEERSAAGKCAEILGGIQVVLDMSVDYVKDREQFGQVVGSFQAVQHHCTNMVVEVDSSRYITMQAIWRIAQGLPATKEVAMAKSYTSAAAIRVTKLGHQTHGAISFCDELDMHLYLRKAHAASVAFGDEEYHLEKVANELGL